MADFPTTTVRRARADLPEALREADRSDPSPTRGRGRLAVAACLMGAAIASGVVVAAPDAGAAAPKSKLKKAARANPAKRAARARVRPVRIASVSSAAALPAVSASPVQSAPPPDAESALYLDLTNAARSQARSCGGVAYNPAPPLEWDARLAQSALQHAQEQAARNTMSHVGADGSSVGARATRVGYPWRKIGENVAWGHDSPHAAVGAWLASPGHCANIMDPSLRHMGMARAGVFWAQDFGAPF